MDPEIPAALLDDVDLLCLDAGNTIVFLDHAVVAAVARDAGHALDPAALARCEGAAKQAMEGGDSRAAPALPDAEILPWWSAFVRTMVEQAGGLGRAESADCVRALWRAHRAFNLWRRVPEGLIAALNTLRAAGVPVCVVSNSEGMLHALFERLGILGAFDHVIDSHALGVEKPDPAIFRHALARFGVDAARALHLGDVVATDIVGARAAGIRAGLIDPLGHYAGLHPDVPRVASATAVARALHARRTGA